MPHQPPRVEDYDSDESKAPNNIQTSPVLTQAAAKRSPRPYGAGLDAAQRPSDKARAEKPGSHKPDSVKPGSDSGYSSRTTTTFGSTNSAQGRIDGLEIGAPALSEGSNRTESTVRATNKTPPKAAPVRRRRDGSLPRPSPSPPREAMSRKHRPRRTGQECDVPGCQQCWIPSPEEYSRDVAELPRRKSSHPTSPPGQYTSAYHEHAFPPTIPRPRPAAASRPRPSSYYSGMPTDQYMVPIPPGVYGPPINSGAPSAYSSGPFPYSSYAPPAPMVTSSPYMAYAQPLGPPNPSRHELRPQLHPIQTGPYVPSRARPSSMYGTPVVSYEPYYYDRPDGSRSAGVSGPRQRLHEHEYEPRETQLRAIAPAPRHNYTSPEESVPTRRSTTRQSKPDTSGRSYSYDPRREEYDSFDPDVELPSSRTPSRRRPSIGPKSASYSPAVESRSAVEKVLESRSGRRSSYYGQASGSKTDDLARSANAYVDAVSGRTAVRTRDPASSKDPLDSTLLVSSRSHSQDRPESSSRSRAGSSQEGGKGRMYFDFSSKDSYSFSGDTEGKIIEVVPKEDGTAEIFVSSAARQQRYPARYPRHGSIGSSAEVSRTGRSATPRDYAIVKDDEPRRSSRSTRRPSNTTP